MELKRVMMFSVGCLDTPPEEQQSVLPGSMGGCLASWPYHRALPARFQLVWCEGTLQASPSLQSQHQRGMLCKLWQCVVECCHAETSLPLDGSAWMAPLVVAGFRPCTALHWGSPGSQQDQCSTIQKSRPTPWEMHPLHICLFHWWMGLPVFRFFFSTLSLLHQPLKHERGFIWHQNLILNLILNLNLVFHIQGHKGEMTRFGSKVFRRSALWSAALAKCDFGFLSVFTKRPVTHWWFGPHS